MGGVIGVDGEAGVGGTFWFELPMAMAKGVPAASKTDEHNGIANDAASTRHLDILIADDTATSLFVSRAMIEALGHKVSVVGTGAEALAVVQQHDFDVVMMDVEMPEMNGLEATRRIRALGGWYLELPILGLSANAMGSDRERAAAAGMTGYLTKPVRKSDIAAALAKLFPVLQPAVI